MLHHRLSSRCNSLRLLTLTLILSFLTLQLSARKTVGVVLSGGGAKGVAHARALKVIEEAGIPIDIVVGTSMGSIVGGLYASGYNAAQLDSIVSAQNWTQLLMDKVDRRKLKYSMRRETEPYILSARFEKSPYEVVKGGLLNGNNIAMLMSELTADRLTPMHYDDLPIRFACVGTDLISGREVVMHDGILVESMRASMAIPGVFAPVRRDSLLLVDGGLCNNYPADVARSMGADVIIGVSVSDSTSTGLEKLETMTGVLAQLLDKMCANKVEENIAMTDVFIQVPVAPYSSASFSKTAIDSLLVRGERAARDKWDELLALREVIGLDGEPSDIQRPRKVLPTHIEVEPPTTIYNRSQRASHIGVGARFDSEELASLLLGGAYEFNHRNHLRLGLQLRLGERFYADMRGSVQLFEKWDLGLRYKFNLNNLEIYDGGLAVADVKYNEHFLRLSLSRSWRMMRLTFGGDFSSRWFTKINMNQNYTTLMSDHSLERHVAYNATFDYDNMDDQMYPHRGMSWRVRYNYYTDNGLQYLGDFGLHIVDAYFKIALPLSRSTTLTPSVSFRSLSSRNEDISNWNYIGGINREGFYLPQQLSFAGLSRIESTEDDVVICGVQLRQRLWPNHYVFGIFNALTTGNHLDDILDEQHYGFALGYGLRTPAGPIEANFNWSEITRSINFYVSLGHTF